jgi:hypothetical protein
MNRKLFTAILAVLLIASFFLPLSASSVSGSAFDIVKGPSSAYGSSLEMMLSKYLWLLIPVSALILLIGALNNENYFLGRGLWAFLPLLTLLYIIGWPLIQSGVKIDFGAMIKGFGVGLWIAIGASLILAVVWPRR